MKKPGVEKGKEKDEGKPEENPDELKNTEILVGESQPIAESATADDRDVIVCTASSENQSEEPKRVPETRVQEIQRSAEDLEEVSSSYIQQQTE